PVTIITITNARMMPTARSSRFIPNDKREWQTQYLEREGSLTGPARGFQRRLEAAALPGLRFAPPRSRVGRAMVGSIAATAHAYGSDPDRGASLRLRWRRYLLVNELEKCCKSDTTELTPKAAPDIP